MTDNHRTRSLHPLTWALCLASIGLLPALPHVASAQEAGCETNADCADTERCEPGIVLEECAQDDCPQPPPGRCVDEFYQQECDTDADCGDNLVCLRLMVACPPFEPECAQDMPGFCDEEGSDAVLAATSGLAPGGETPTAAASGGPTTASSGEAPEMDPESGSSESSSGCSVSAGAGGGLGVLGQAVLLTFALVALRRRSARA